MTCKNHTAHSHNRQYRFLPCKRDTSSPGKNLSAPTEAAPAAGAALDFTDGMIIQCSRVARDSPSDCRCHAH
jgi:hypothetical protein